MEIEIKLAPVLQHEAAAFFEGESFFEGAAETVRMKATYYDTPERALKALGFSFRERLEGERVVYCLKGPRRGNSRFEEETRADGLNAAAEELCKREGLPPQAAAVLLSENLVPVFRTDFVRKRRNALYGGSLIEISFDKGEVEREGKRAAISELELELKRGEESDLTALSDYICGKYGFKVSRGTKASRAERMTDEEYSKMQEVNPFFIGSEMLNYCINCGWVQYELSDDGRLRYYLTPEGKAEMEKRFGINFGKPCAGV